MHDTIKNVACVGSGLIGQGWATLFAAGGYTVAMHDLTDNRLERAVRQVNLNLGFLEDNGRLPPAAAGTAFSRIRTTTDLSEALNNADYVQESVPDNYRDKKKIFREMDALAPSGAILASSSSGLLMSEIQTVVTRPERCLLVHPFLPVHLLPLVEVVGGDKTDPETVRTTCEIMEKLGKTPVRLKKEVPGYIVNRLQAAVLREAIDLVTSGVAGAEEVDRAFCAGMGMRDPFIGPLLRAYLAGDGIESFLENYAASYRVRWESMAAWNEISPPQRDVLIKSVNDMPVVRENALEKIKNWRDKMLIKILKLDRNCC
jgi:carnitine 3-dehydrogenase